MKSISSTLIAFLTLAFLSITSNGAWAQATVSINLKNKVNFEIPGDWQITDREHRKRVTEMTQEMVGVSNLAHFAAMSHPPPSRAYIRVSFPALDPPITQADLRREVRADRRQLLKDFEEAWTEEVAAFRDGLAKIGSRQVGKAKFDVINLGGLMAIVIDYARTSSHNPSETMLVTQYHVVMGDETTLITLSRIAQDPKAVAAHDRLLKSIRFK